MTLVNPKYGLYPYQYQVLRDLLAVLKCDSQAVAPLSRRAIVHMPTGAGKTRVACHAACHLLSQPEAKNKLIVWLASSEELCEQAADNLTEAWSYLGTHPVELYRFWGNSNLNPQHLNHGFLVAGLAKMLASAKCDVKLLVSLAESVGAVIFDEAHQAIAETYRFLTEQLLAFQPPLMGLTATPGRTAEVGAPDYELAEMFNFNKVTVDARGHANPVFYLIKHGFLAEPEFFHIDIESQVKVQPPIQGADYTDRDLHSIGRDKLWHDTIVEISSASLISNSRVMAFCPSVRSARDCARSLAIQGYQAEYVSANSSSEERKRIISKYRQDSDEPMVLFNYGVLTAGFDAPRTRCLLVARPTTSLVLYSQMVGRAMRGPKSGGNRRCKIYTVVDTSLPGFGSVAEAFRNWEEIW